MTRCEPSISPIPERLGRHGEVLVDPAGELRPARHRPDEHGRSELLAQERRREYRRRRDPARAARLYCRSSCSSPVVRCSNSTGHSRQASMWAIFRSAVALTAPPLVERGSSVTARGRAGARRAAAAAADAAARDRRPRASRAASIDADHDERVGEVERRPPAHVEEVGHVAQPDAVGEVREAAAEHEPERHGQHRMPRARAREERDHPRHRDACQDDHDRTSHSRSSPNAIPEFWT